MSSMPAEMRTRPSVMPIAARRSAGTDACVIVAGWEMSVSTPPRLSASAISRTLFRSAPRGVERCRGRTRACRRSPRIWRCASSCCGWSGSPGSRPAAPSDAPARNSASARPLALCCAMRSASVLVPRSTSQESNGLRIAPAAFWTNCSHSMSSSRAATTTPPMLSLWPFRYFVVLCTTRSAPSSIGRWRHGLANVLSTTSRDVVAVRELGRGREVGQAHHRVGRRLEEQQLRLRA